MSAARCLWSCLQISNIIVTNSQSGSSTALVPDDPTMCICSKMFTELSADKQRHCQQQPMRIQFFGDTGCVGVWMCAYTQQGFMVRSRNNAMHCMSCYFLINMRCLFQVQSVIFILALSLPGFMKYGAMVDWGLTGLGNISQCTHQYAGPLLIMIMDRPAMEHPWTGWWCPCMVMMDSRQQRDTKFVDLETDILTQWPWKG